MRKSELILSLISFKLSFGFQMETHNMDTTPAVCTIVTVLVFLPITMSHGALQEQILGEGSEWETVYEQ